MARQRKTDDDNVFGELDVLDDVLEQHSEQRKAFERETRPQMFDWSTPLADSDGVIPEFVNISPNIQIVTIPNNPGGSISVPPMGILKGAQWRDPYITPNAAWGDYPFFIEREKVEVKGEDGKKKVGYDPKYLMSEQQVLNEICGYYRKLSYKKNKQRIRSLVDNQILMNKPDGEPLLKHDPQLNCIIRVKSRDDRYSVIVASEDRIRQIDEKEMSSQEKADTYEFSVREVR